MSKQKGQGLLEFALILIPLLMLVLGIIEAARLFHAYIAVQHAAREAARYAITGRPFDEFDPAEGPFCKADNIRVEHIKDVAKAQAFGLPVDYWGLTPADFDDNLTKPGFFGVEIHGFDAYDQPEQRDDPGQPGLPVRVRVVYNIIMLDPFYRAIVPQIRLVGHAEMVNEGIQVGHGGEPLPTFGPTPTLPAPPTATQTPTVLPTSTPEGAYIALDTYFAVAGQDITIELIQHDPNTSYDVYWITPDSVETLIGTYTTDGSGYRTLSYTVPGDSDSGDYTIESREGGSFVADVVLQVQGPTPTSTNTPTPTQTGTPTMTPTLTPTPEGAYIALCEYYAIPGQDINIELIQHDPNTTYEVYWITPTSVETLIDTSTTNGEGYGLLGYTVPLSSGDGTYTIESRLSGAFVASVELEVLTVTPTPTVDNPPDLIITEIALGSPEAVPGTPVTITVEIQNNGNAVSDLFDIDLYVDPEYQPLSGRPGTRKQWQDGLAEGATATLVFDVTFYGAETLHQVWGQVDTTNYVDSEADEDNNISGPVDITTAPSRVCYLEDDMESGTGSWSAVENYEDGSQVAPFALVEHGSGYYGSSSHSWWIEEASHHLRSYLTSPSVSIPSDASDLELVFWHRMRSEEDWDGGYLRYKIGSGSWTTVESSMFASGSYNSQVHNWWHTRSAWAGDVGPRQVVVNVPAAASGNSIQFRWQWESDWSWRPSTPPRRGWWVDDVSICTENDPAEPPEQPKPPGLEECVQVIENGNFEDASTDPWQYPLPPLETQRVGGGYPMPSTFAMRLSATTVLWDFRPWLYQDLTMPDFTTTSSTATLNLYKKVCDASSGCPNSPGQPDPLYVVLQTTGGVTLTQDILVALGTESSDYQSWSQDLFDPSTRLGGFDPLDYAGSDLRLYFYAPNDGTADTWFFMDTLECQVCTEQAIPSKDPTKVTVGGLAQVLLGGVPRNLEGIDVYAYTEDDDLFSTYTIQDSTYHFYWQLPPGETIYIYAETYIGSYRYWTQATVDPMAAGEENHDVDLLLLQG
jgi:hypothetical protein